MAARKKEKDPCFFGRLIAQPPLHARQSICFSIKLSCILKKHCCIRHWEEAGSTTAFASEPPGAGVSQKQFALELLYIYRKYWLPVRFYDMLNAWVYLRKNRFPLT